MTLSFSTRWGKNMGNLAGQPNYFIEKIWSGLLTNIGYVSAIEATAYMEEFSSEFGYDLDYTKIGILPKLHTIRHDPHDRWKAGNKIHFVINNRTKNRFQFAPVIECSATQDFEIKEWVMTSKPAIKLADGRVFTVRIDGGYLFYDEFEQVAMSDGFPSVEHFFKWFGADTLPDTKIIHWTEMQY